MAGAVPDTSAAPFKRSRSCTVDLRSIGAAHVRGGTTSVTTVNSFDSVGVEDAEVDIVNMADRNASLASGMAIPGAHPRAPETVSYVNLR